MTCKLTDQDGRTYGRCQWGPGVTHETDGSGELCGPGWLHYYSDPLLAVLLNSIHADFAEPRLWEVLVEGIGKRDLCGLKFGATRLTTIREIPVPKITTVQRVRFAILCALEVYAEPTFALWAEAWLSGADRSPFSAARAAEIASRASADAVAVWVKKSALAAWEAASAATQALTVPQAAAESAAWAVADAVFTVEWTAQASDAVTVVEVGEPAGTAQWSARLEEVAPALRAAMTERATPGLDLIALARQAVHGSGSDENP